VLRDSSTVTLESSLVSGNEGRGLYLSDSTIAELVDNDIRENQDEGVYLEDSSEATLDDNRITDNGDAGIYIGRKKVNISLRGNKITGNKTGIELVLPDRFEGSIEGTGNQISQNDQDFKGLTEELRKSLR